MFGNKKGPENAGEKTGRGLGFCTGNNQPGYMSDQPRMGMGRGRGRMINPEMMQEAATRNLATFGRGRGFGCGRGFGKGFGRGMGRGRGFMPMNYGTAPVTNPKKPESGEKE